MKPTVKNNTSGAVRKSCFTVNEQPNEANLSLDSRDIDITSGLAFSCGINIDRLSDVITNRQLRASYKKFFRAGVDFRDKFKVKLNHRMTLLQERRTGGMKIKSSKSSDDLSLLTLPIVTERSRKNVVGVNEKIKLKPYRLDVIKYVPKLESPMNQSEWQSSQMDPPNSFEFSISHEPMLKEKAAPRFVFDCFPFAIDTTSNAKRDFLGLVRPQLDTGGVPVTSYSHENKVELEFYSPFLSQQAVATLIFLWDFFYNRVDNL